MKRKLLPTQNRILLIILHPHPYMGGSPNNNVVELFLDLPFQIYTPQLIGLVAECEVKRIKKKVRQLDFDKCYIIGYSYGSLVAALLAQEVKCDKLMLISIPYSVSIFCTLQMSKIKQFLKNTEIPLKIVHGSDDQFASPLKIQQNFKEVTVLSSVDHFWFYKEKELLEIGSHFLLNESRQKSRPSINY